MLSLLTPMKFTYAHCRREGVRRKLPSASRAEGSHNTQCFKVWWVSMSEPAVVSHGQFQNFKYFLLTSLAEDILLI